jgi:hypothetical protein
VKASHIMNIAITIDYAYKFLVGLFLIDLFVVVERVGECCSFCIISWGRGSWSIVVVLRS